MQGVICSSWALVCFSHSPAESWLVQSLLPLNLTLFHVNAVRRCFAVRNGLYGHRWPGMLARTQPFGTALRWGGAPFPGTYLLLLGWGFTRVWAVAGGGGWTFWDAVRASTGWGSASGEVQAEWEDAQSTWWALRLSAGGGWVYCSTCTGVHACPALRSLLCSPLASRTAVRNPQASPEAFSSGK